MMSFFTLRRREDQRSVVVVLISTILLILPFSFHPKPTQGIFLVTANTIAFYLCSIVNHNLIHSKVFESVAADKLLSLWLTLIKGHSATSLIVMHNKNHHRFNGSSEDFVSPKRAGKGKGVIRMLRYLKEVLILTTHPRHFKGDENEGQILLENFTLIIFILILCFIDLRTFLIFTLIPWILSLFFLILINLFQHDHCDLDSEWNHSRNFIGSIPNFFMFNNGYHTIHHLDPSLHWADLKEEHEKKVSPHIDKRLEEKSLSLFILKNYFLS